ncbi:MAG TPA: site-specific integrase [Mucilaginibacter sp.]|jgi:integrase
MDLIVKRAKVSLYLDTRRPVEDGKFPLKLRVYFDKAKLFDLNRTLSEDDFEKSYLAKKPRGDEHRELKIELAAIEATANDVIDGLKLFTFEKFSKLIFATKRSLTDVVGRYASYIQVLEKAEQDGTASSYSCSINSLKEFYNEGRKYPSDEILFETFTPDFLTRYENWFVGKGLSRTSVGIYLRPLRKMFNDAIEDKIIDKDIYPFKKYKIPTGKNTKKAIEADGLKKLYMLDLKGNSFQEKARAFWFFSYQCNGMNIRDISELRAKDFRGSYFTFLRHKTKNTTKEDPKPIIVPITDYVQDVIEKYGNLDGRPNDYVFPVFTHEMTSKEKFRANQNFVRFINQHMKRAAADNGLKIKTGTMEARHSFTTQVTRKQGLEFAQEALGHTTLVATQNYWAGFESETKREMADMLMKFEEPKKRAKAKINTKTTRRSAMAG